MFKLNATIYCRNIFFDIFAILENMLENGLAGAYFSLMHVTSSTIYMLFVFDTIKME